MSTPIVALDVGTEFTTAVAGESTDKGIEIFGSASVPTYGVAKGQIVDIERATGSIKQVIHALSDSANITVNTVLATFSSGSVHYTTCTGQHTIHPKEAITEDEIYAVLDNANSNPLPDDHVYLYSFKQLYSVDGQPGVKNPLGMRCGKLELNTLRASAPQIHVENLRTAIENASLSVAPGDILLSPVADAYALASKEERDAGVLVINLGAGTIDYIAIASSIVIACGSLAVGSKHINNDLAKAFQITIRQAEVLKMNFGAAIIQPEHADDRTTLPASFGTVARSISVHAIQTVINARLDESLRIIQETLQQQGLLHMLHDHIILTGSTAALPGIVKLAENIFQIPTRCASEIHAVKWLNPPPDINQYSSAAGAVVWAAKHATNKQDPSAGFIKKVINFLVN